MLTETYIEVLLVDEHWADQVWELWIKGFLNDATAFLAWYIVCQAGVV